MKKVLVFVLCIIILYATPAYAYKNNEYESDGYRYVVLPDKTIQLTYIPWDSHKKKCVIPSIVNDFKVTSVKSSALEFVFNEHIVFSEGIEELVGNGGYYSTKEITFPSSMVKFSNGKICFPSADKLEKINISPDNPIFGVKDGFVYNKETNTLLYYPNAAKNKKVTTPKGIETINSGCFSCLKHVENIVIYEGVKTICFGAFSFCEKLKTVTLPSTLNWDSYEYDFDGCNQMAKITISIKNPNLVVQNGALINNSTRKVLYMPPQSKIKSYIIPDDIVDIEYGAFSNCTSLEKVSIPKTVEIIEGHAFYGCSKLKHVDLEEGIQFIANTAFDNCPHLINMTYPQSAQSFLLPPSQYTTEEEEARLRYYGY